MIADCAGNDCVEIRDFWCQSLVGGTKNLCICEIQRSNSLIQEGRLSRILFNQKDLQFWQHNFERQAGKSGAGSDVGEPTCAIFDEFRAEKLSPKCLDTNSWGFSMEVRLIF